jgi:hypothetical protein
MMRNYNYVDEDSFVCEAPVGYGLLPFLILIIGWIVVRMVNGMDAASGFWVILVFCAMFLVTCVTSRWNKLTVYYDEARYRSLLGCRTDFDMRSVEKLTYTNSMYYIYLASGKKLRLISGMSNIKVLEERCKRDGIPVEHNSKKSITKFRLAMYCVEMLIKLFCGLIVVFLIGLFVFVLVNQKSDNISILSKFLSILYELRYLGVGVLVFVPISCLITLMGVLSRVRSIEKKLGVNFDAEMRARDAKGTEYYDDEWFVRYANGNSTVLNIRLVKRFVGTKGARNNCELTYEDINGRTVTTEKCYEDEIRILENWMKQALAKQ